MGFIKNLFKRLFSETIRARYRSAYIIFIRNTKRKYFSKSGRHTELFGPLILDPNFVEMDNHTRMLPFNRVISAGGRVVVKKYTGIGSGCTFIPGSHVPTVGLPQFLSRFHINDIEKTLVIGEDVWIGANCTFLCKASVGRGAVVGACSLVTNEVPPYAVVAGSPAKVIATRFTLEQIIEHERILYPEEERLSLDFLDNIFATKYKGLRSIGTSEISNEDLNRLNKLKEEFGIKNYAECK